MPALSSTMTEGKIVSWLMGEGDAIGKGDAVVVVESDKADMDVESFVDGIIAHIAVGDGEVATVGAPIAYVVDSESEIEAAKAKAGGAPAPAAPAPAARGAPRRAGAGGARAGGGGARACTGWRRRRRPRGSGRVVATPYAKKLAKKHKVDLKTLAGTGLNGRITAVDIENAAGLPPTPKAGAAPAPAGGRGRRAEEGGRRRASGARRHRRAALGHASRRREEHVAVSLCSGLPHRDEHLHRRVRQALRHSQAEGCDDDRLAHQGRRRRARAAPDHVLHLPRR